MKDPRSKEELVAGDPAQVAMLTDRRALRYLAPPSPDDGRRRTPSASRGRRPGGATTLHLIDALTLTREQARELRAELITVLERYKASPGPGRGYLIQLGLAPHDWARPARLGTSATPHRDRR